MVITQPVTSLDNAECLFFLIKKMNHVEFLKMASSGAEIVKFIKLQEYTMKLQQLYISFFTLNICR